MAHPPSESAVLITGGSRGIGRTTADHLLAAGYSVFVTVRKQSQFDELEAKAKGGRAIRPVLMDVSTDEHTSAAVERVQTLLREEKVKLLAVVNNAGINPEGDKIIEAKSKGVEYDTSLADPSIASRVLETNVVGVARVTRAFLPLLCDGGRVINIGSYFGSIAGQIGLNHAYYESSKFALEGLSDNMRRALKKEGKWVCLVKPGNISTEMNTLAGEVPASVVAEDIEHAVSSTKPRARYYPGKVKGYSTRMVCWIFEMLPTWVTDSL